MVTHLTSVRRRKIIMFWQCFFDFLATLILILFKQHFTNYSTWSTSVVNSSSALLFFLGSN